MIPQAVTGSMIQSPSLDVEPQPGTQFDSVNDFFQLSVTESYSVNSGPTLTEEQTLGPAQLLDFDGNLVFGSLVTVFTSLANTPVRGALGGMRCRRHCGEMNNNSGYVVASPNHTYGDGTPLKVAVLLRATATLFRNPPRISPARSRTRIASRTSGSRARTRCCRPPAHSST